MTISPQAAASANLPGVCSSCGRRTPALLVLPSPSGEYGLCVICVGKDAEPRQPSHPTSIPAPRSRR